MTDDDAKATPLPMPAVAERIFGGTAPLAVRYAELLATAGVERGLIGPREVPRLWERHILNCVVVEELVPRDARVVDLGSGAGLPGIVLALARTDLFVTLLEPLLRRTVFLAECIEELGLRNIEVVRGRAEDWGPRPRADVVTARAVAPLERLADWSLPLLHDGGVLLALKGAAAAAELRASERTLRRIGAVEWSVVQAGSGMIEPPTTVVRVVKATGTRRRTEGQPRSTGPTRRARGSRRVR